MFRLSVYSRWKEVNRRNRLLWHHVHWGFCRRSHSSARWQLRSWTYCLSRSLSLPDGHRMWIFSCNRLKDDGYWLPMRERPHSCSIRWNKRYNFPEFYRSAIIITRRNHLLSEYWRCGCNRTSFYTRQRGKKSRIRSVQNENKTPIVWSLLPMLFDRCHNLSCNGKRIRYKVSYP